MNFWRLRLIPSLCVCSSLGLGQAPDSGRQITLDVVVTDKSGKPVSGLAQQDFTLLDNKQPQRVISFKASTETAPAADRPVEAVLVMDAVNAPFSAVSYARTQIEKYLQGDKYLENNGALPVPTSLAFFTDSGMQIGNVTSREGKALVAELDQNQTGLRTITRAQGVYGADERLELSLNALAQLAAYETPRPGRKLVIWISPGWPLLTGPRIELSGKDQRDIFARIVAMSDTLRRAGITLYSIDPLGTADAGQGQTYYYEEFVKGVKKPNQVQIGNLALQALTVQTGGRVRNSNNDVAAEIASDVADARSFYVLTFEGLPGDGPNEYHALEIKLDKPGLKALTRTGYYAQP